MADWTREVEAKNNKKLKTGLTCREIQIYKVEDRKNDQTRMATGLLRPGQMNPGTYKLSL